MSEFAREEIKLNMHNKKVHESPIVIEKPGHIPCGKMNGMIMRLMSGERQ